MLISLILRLEITIHELGRVSKKVKRFMSNPPPSPILVSDLIDGDLRKWNLSSIESLISKEELMTIFKIPLRMLNELDELIWHHDKRGRISIKSAYQLAISPPLVNQSPPHLTPLIPWNKLWGLPIPYKIRHFI